MGIHLVTGYAGQAHITSADQGAFNAGHIGTGDYVLALGKMFEGTIVSSINTVRIYDGHISMQGRHISMDVDTFESFKISPPGSLYRRADLIVMRYTKNVDTGVETAELAIKTGKIVASGNPIVTPECTTGDILNGAITHEMPLYRVVCENEKIKRLDCLFTVIPPISNGLYKQNMLINGDFQCNQRGNKTYDVANTAEYTVDMWRAHQVKVDVLNEGVTVTGKSSSIQGYFTQFIQLGKLKTTSYTISAMVDGEICNFTVTPGASAKEKAFARFKITCLTTSTWDDSLGDYNNKLKINICPNGTNAITITYVDVFEGNVAYPHVKEDYGTALMRCGMFVKKKGYSVPLIRSRYENASVLENSSVILWYNLAFDTMANAFNAPLNPPQIESLSWNFYYSSEDSSGNVAFGQVQGTIDTITAINNASGVEMIGLKKADVTLSGVVREPSNPAVYGSYVVTCEPRDS